MIIDLNGATQIRKLSITKNLGRPFHTSIVKDLQIIGAVQSRIDCSQNTCLSIDLFLAQHGPFNVAVNQTS